MTAQFYENLLYNGEVFSMAEIPLYDYLEQNNIIIPDADCTACWRGYIGKWEIINDKLFLTSLNVLGNRNLNINSYFPGKTKVFADWYSGEIRLPIGELLEYEHHGFGSIYEKDLFLVIENGILVKQYEVDNNTEELQTRLKEKEIKENENLVRQIKNERIGNLIGIIILTLLFLGICTGIFYLIKWGTIIAYIILTPITCGIIYLIFLAIKNRIKTKYPNKKTEKKL